MPKTLTALLIAAALLLGACGDDVPTPLADGSGGDEEASPAPGDPEPIRMKDPDAPTGTEPEVFEEKIQTIGDLAQEEVAGGFMNPSGLAVGPEGALYICDSGGGRVMRLQGGRASEQLVGFDTEYWKVDPKTKEKSFKLGPLSVIVMPDGSFYVTDGGKPDGKEAVLHFTQPSIASDGKPSNTVGPTSDDAADKGEGNLTGMSLSPDRRTIYVAGQGSDAKSWVLRYDIARNKLEPWASADDNGISVNSPMQTLVWDAKTVLVLYSGEGGKEDGLIVAWDIPTAKPRAQWRLIGLVDPMGFARIPGTDDLVVVDNNWDLTKVKRGVCARLTLPEGGGDVTPEKLVTGLWGPTACVFGKDGTLYIAQLGKKFDGRHGNVLKVTGIK